MTVPLLQLEDVRRVYGTTAEVAALKSVDFVVSAGDYVAVVGRSGAGKSTLLNILGLLEIPSSGRYLVNGRDAAHETEARRTALRASTFGFVFQAFHLLRTHTVRENVELGLLYHSTAPRRRAEVVDAVIAQVGLSHRAESYPATLSGGEQQRVAIARALVGRPPVLLCDEPTGNLDSITADSILDLLENLNASGVSIIMITHDRNVARRARRQVTMDDGHLRE